MNFKHKSGNFKKKTTWPYGQLPKSAKTSETKEPLWWGVSQLFIWSWAGSMFIQDSPLQVDASLKWMPGQSRSQALALQTRRKTPHLSGPMLANRTGFWRAPVLVGTHSTQQARPQWARVLGIAPVFENTPRALCLTFMFSLTSRACVSPGSNGHARESLLSLRLEHFPTKAK